MNILERLSSLNRELLYEEDMDRVLNRLMDTALELAKAQNGFLILKSEGSGGPLPGYSVVVARNISKEALESDEFKISLSAIREAMEKREPVLTDNALQDARFRDAKSVQLHQLKSILALPVMGKEEVMGVFYLDQPLETGLIDSETLAALKTFSDLSALAVQKARMIETLSDEVEETTGQVKRLERELAENRLKLKYEYSDIVGRSPKMLQVLGMVDKITESKVPVWIYGESGTGKESIARALHYNSSRAKYPFVTENCSALPETLLESELFGHKKGAFTHADRDKKGILEYANRGTIFLDEIADMSPNLQAKLLRFLQEGEIRPLGSNEVIKVDVRVISASNKDLAQLVENEKFREDLFFRLNGVTVSLPPLRDRREDIPLLAEYFLKKITQRDKKDPIRLHPDTLRVFMDYPWPGNIRELQNTLETAVLFVENDSLSTKALQFKPVLFNRKKSLKRGSGASMPREAMDPDLERLLLTLREQGYHKGNTARALGISRRNLYDKLDKYGIPLELQPLRKFIEEKFV
jgi:Nif-specific regulatory protein